MALADPLPSRLVRLADLRPGDLDAVLAHEGGLWESRLGWDYSPTAEMLRRSVGGSFHGFALRGASRVVAYAYFLPDRERSLVGSVHALPEAEPERPACRLLDRALDHLIHGVRARRVESQFLFFGGEDPAATFQTWGARRFRRQFLAGPIDRVVARAAPAPADVSLRSFIAADTKAAAAIIHRSFLGSADAAMSDCYRTFDGCTSFVDSVLTRTGCGVFTPEASYLVVLAGRPAGVVLASRVGPRTGHIVQISVDPACQQRGIGNHLMHAACAAMGRRGMAQVSLSVTLANARAHGWYTGLGLVPVKDFDAWVWER